MILVTRQENTVHCETLSLDPAIEKYVDVVRRYCLWAESFPGEPHREMITARLLLSELHLSVINLPPIEFCEDSKSHPLAQEALKSVHERFSQLPVAGYWDVFDPLESCENRPVFGLLADDLTDIYRDLKTHLALFDAGRINEALSLWRFSFLTNWGYHVAGVQHVLHSYFANEQLNLD